MSDYGVNTAVMERVFGFTSRSKNAVHVCTALALKEVGRRLVDYSVVGDPGLWKKPPRKGYMPGLFVNNWQLGIDDIPSGMFYKQDPLGSDSLNRLSKVGRWPAYHDYFFANNVPYAAALEYGFHSTQVPAGGIMAKVRLEFPQIIQTVLQQYHSGVGDVTDFNQVGSTYGN